MKKNIIFASILSLTLLLTGCGAFVAGVATGGLVVYDGRDMKTMMDDQKIRQQVISKINEDPELKESNISISSFYRMVLLTGQTPIASLKVKAEKIAREHPKVKRVYNEIVIGEPISFSARANDTWLTTKVKSKLLATPELKSGNIKVVTENKSVYLIGIVTEKQAELAVNGARQISGVERVVKAFKYLTAKEEDVEA